MFNLIILFIIKIKMNIMKKKKIKLHFDKKVISNLTKIQRSNVMGGGTLSNAPDAQSICLCGPAETEANTCGCPDRYSGHVFCLPMSRDRC